MSETSGTAQTVLLVAARLLPAWLSYLVLSSLFFMVWLHPSWIGWSEAAGLTWFVGIEVAGVAALAFLLSGRDEVLSWLPIVPTAALLGLVLWIKVGPWVAVVLPLHLVFRSVVLWRDDRRARQVFGALGLSGLVIVMTWLAVGLVPLPSLGWSASVTPVELWWQVLTWRGWKRVPFALPAWGCLYFFLTSMTHLFDVRWYTLENL